MTALTPHLARLQAALLIIATNSPTFSKALPLTTTSEANAHTHWRERQRRAKAQREAVTLLMHRLRADLRLDLAHRDMVVRLVRVAPCELDSDNLAGALKHVRDSVAELLGVDDRDPQVTWVVDQQYGPAGVVIETYPGNIKTVEVRP